VSWRRTAFATSSTAYWPASVPSPSNATTVSFSMTQWVFTGAGWNGWVVAGAPRAFSGCAARVQLVRHRVELNDEVRRADLNLG
jgi:hypothetical protein